MSVYTPFDFKRGDDAGDLYRVLSHSVTFTATMTERIDTGAAGPRAHAGGPRTPIARREEEGREAYEPEAVRSPRSNVGEFVEVNI